jgi:hypothetical protein
MFENIFNGMFGKVAPGMCRLTMNGKIAVKCSNGYKTYNVSKGTLTNVSNFCFNVGEELFFIFPTSHVKIGDIILIGGKPKCVIKTEDNKTITVIDYENTEVKQIVPERHIFMGSTYYYGKIVSLLGNMSGKGPANMLKMAVIGQLLSGGKESGNAGFGGGLGQMMAMSMFFGGKEGNMFEDMLDFQFDEPDTTDDDDDENNEKEE